MQYVIFEYKVKNIRRSTLNFELQWRLYFLNG